MTYGSLVRKLDNLMDEIKLRQQQHRPRRRLSEMLVKLRLLQLKKEIRGIK